MEAKDTVMSDEQIEAYLSQETANEKALKHFNVLTVDKLLQAQAEISFKAGQESVKDDWNRAIDLATKYSYQAGIREVVEWLTDNCACFQPDPEKNGEYIIPGWQAKLKEWGIE